MSPLQSVRRAALFVADVLASVKLAPFLKKHKIKDKAYGQRLIDRLRTKHSLAPASRPGRPRTYTEEQLAAGQAELSKPSHPHHSKAELVRTLKEKGRLPTSAKPRGYGAALKRSLGEQGLQLGYGPRTKLHAISTADKKSRLEWCQRMQHIITESTVKVWWFEDEKMISGGGKMRSEWGSREGVGESCGRQSCKRQRAVLAGWPLTVCERAVVALCRGGHQGSWQRAAELGGWWRPGGRQAVGGMG
jgi:hypothetical protein